MSGILWFSAVLLMILGVFVAGHFRQMILSDLIYASGVALGLAASVMEHDWLLAGFWGALLWLSIMRMIQDWRRRRKDRKAAGSGYKARLILAKMTARMRALKPRPALRPVPDPV